MHRATTALPLSEANLLAALAASTSRNQAALGQEAASFTITLDIASDLEAGLATIARAHGLSAEQYARQVIGQALASAADRKPLASRIREIWADIPDEVRAKLPPDGASQHDHYIYGFPGGTG